MRVPNEFDQLALKHYEKEIRRISKKLGLTHGGSCLSVLPILYEIYGQLKKGDVVGLSGAHSHLAHLMFTNFEKAEELIKRHGIHCDRDAGCDITGGSLAHSGIALGMAFANPKIKVYWIETDGSAGEGSCWEMLRIKKLSNIDNLVVYVNMNGYTAVSEIDTRELEERLRAFDRDIKIRYTKNGAGLEGVAGHYKKL